MSNGITERTIVVIDDDDAVRESIVALLEVNRRDVVSFASAHDFLSSFRSLAYCLILDVAMPGMTGPELVRHLAARAALPPTILLTANTDDPACRTALLCGVHDVLEKPVAETTLLEAIDAAAARDKGNSS